MPPIEWFDRGDRDQAMLSRLGCILFYICGYATGIVVLLGLAVLAKLAIVEGIFG